MILMEQLKSIKRELGLEKDDKAALISRWGLFVHGVHNVLSVHVQGYVSLHALIVHAQSGTRLGPRTPCRPAPPGSRRGGSPASPLHRRTSAG